VKEPPQASSFDGGGDGFMHDSNIKNNILVENTRSKVTTTTNNDFPKVFCNFEKVKYRKPLFY
jgi:hypothetical protein